MFKPPVCRYSIRSQMALKIHLRKANIGQKCLSFIGLKIQSKINPSIKNFKITAFYTCFEVKIHIASSTNTS